jgi:carbon starvation protein CstA
MMFITFACGPYRISFHSVAVDGRLPDKKRALGRRVFYGAMKSEGIVAMDLGSNRNEFLWRRWGI